NMLAQPLLDVISNVENQQGGNILLMNSDGYYLVNTQNPQFTFAFEDGISLLGRAEGEEYRLQTLLPEEDAESILNTVATGDPQRLTTTIRGSEFNVYYNVIVPRNAPEGYHWILAHTLDRAIITAAVNQRSLVTGAGVLGAIMLAVFTVLLVSRRITTPLADMSERALRIAQGDYAAADDVTYSRRGDEIGDLSRAFTDMSRQVRDAVTNLETRVAARTADIQTSAEIASAANQIRNVDDLISLSVNLLRDRFDFYYAQIYLIDENKEYAVLADGTGYVGRLLLGREHKLSLNGRSLVATSIREGKLVLVQDTAQDSRHLANPLLPDTRSELVVPLRSRDATIGALDIQHNIEDAFSEDAQQLFQALADQLGVTFENVRLLTQAEERARDLSAVAQVGTEAASTLDV
ncbi:MAG: GAF domain-containing protein, partial [Anaerolineae bacterium]|nr:GAF domain-containing protein [Anaerolineae bacterium]